MFSKRFCFWLFIWITISSLSACQSVDKTFNQQKQIATSTTPLTLTNIYQEGHFTTDNISKIRWLKNKTAYTVIEDSAKETTNEEGKLASIGNEIVIYQGDNFDRSILITAAQLTPKHKEKPLDIDNYIWSADQQKLLIYTNSKKVWRSNSRGDYWLLDLTTNQLTQLGADNMHDSQLMFAKFSPDTNKVAYVFHNNIYVQTLDNLLITQLTHSTESHIINGLFDWVYEEEFAIRDGFRWSPDSKKIAYWQLNTSGSQNFIMINNTDNLYPTLTEFPYPKVGEKNALANIGIIDLDNSQTHWVELPNNNSDMYIPRMNWSGNSDAVLIQHVNRQQNINKLYLSQSNSGQSQLIMTEQDDAFLDRFRDPKWLAKGKSFIWLSEKNGWRHIYRINRNGQNSINLTPDDFDVIQVSKVDEKTGWLYFIASPNNATQKYLYRSKLDASITNQRITPEQYSGTNSYQLSDDKQWAIHTYTNFDSPPKKYLISLPDHKNQRLLLDNQELVNKLKQLPLAKTEFFQVNTRDDLTLDAYIMRPANFDEHKKYPIIFYVYGGPAGQTVKDTWFGKRYLWEQFLTQQGFIIASVDNRGTPAAKGRAWRKSIYGAVGVLSSRDQADALTAISKRWSYIDTDRVGIWGHSGGGSMALNMLFRYPEQYQVGISSAPVADQRLYDTIYQERYSGLLPDYAQGYQQGSPITHAKNLQGKLLLIHGTADDNVHYQGSERLINELIKHNKVFNFMPYPNRSHSLAEGEGTQLHYKTLKTEFFKQYLQP